MVISSQERLRDGNIRLRNLIIPDDIPVACVWYQDAELVHFSEGDYVAYDEDTVVRMYRWLSNRGFLFLIEYRPIVSSAWIPIGDAALCRDMVPIAIGDKAHRSRGIGTRVLRLLISEARACGWDKVIAHKIFIDNIRSIRMYERCGFRRVSMDIDHAGRPFYRYERILSWANS